MKGCLHDNVHKENEPVYNKKNLKTKIKSYNNKINTNFRGSNVPKEVPPYSYLSILVIDSAFKVDKNYYPTVLLEKRKYKIKEKKIDTLITDDTKTSF